MTGWKAPFYVVVVSILAAGVLGVVNRLASPPYVTVKTYSINGRTHTLDAAGNVHSCRIGFGEWFKPRSDGLCHAEDAPK